MQKLNAGCGRYPKHGYLNVDLRRDSGADVLCDLSAGSWPFKDEQFALVECDHVLEHLPDPLVAMREVHRILERGGRAVIRVPHFTRGFTHWDHRRGFDVTLPLFFDPSFEEGYTGIELRHVSTRLTWFAQRYFKKNSLSPASYYTGLVLGAIFDALGNLNHYFTSRLLCFWVGGYDEVEFVFEK